MMYYGGYSQSEIAGALGVPLGTVKSRMRLGLQALRRTLGPGEVGGHGGNFGPRLVKWCKTPEGSPGGTVDHAAGLPTSFGSSVGVVGRNAAMDSTLK